MPIGTGLFAGILFVAVVLVLVLLLRWKRMAGRPPLIRAIEAGDIGAVRRLLEAGADPYALPSPAEYSKWRTRYFSDAPPVFQEPPFMVAIGTGKTEMVQAFLDSGCNPNAPIKYLDLTVEYDAEAVARLEKETSPNTASRDISIPVWHALGESFRWPIGCAITAAGFGNANLDMVRFLIEKRADLNAADAKIPSPLDEAIQSERMDILELVLQNGAYAGAGTHCLQSAVTVAGLGLGAERTGVIDGLNKIIALLLSYGAEVNDQDEEGWSALHCAASSGYTGTAELLLECGADIHARTAKGETPLALAQESAEESPECRETAELLERCGGGE